MPYRAPSPPDPPAPRRRGPLIAAVVWLVAGTGVCAWVELDLVLAVGAAFLGLVAFVLTLVALRIVFDAVFRTEAFLDRVGWGAGVADRLGSATPPANPRNRATEPRGASSGGQR